MFFNYVGFLLWNKLRERDKFYWDNVDAFGRHPSPPEEVKNIPVIFAHGIFFVDLFTNYRRGCSGEGVQEMHEVFSRILISMNIIAKEQTKGCIRKVGGRFVRVEIVREEIDGEVIYMQVHTNNLVLIRA